MVEARYSNPRSSVEAGILNTKEILGDCGNSLSMIGPAVGPKGNRLL